MSLVTVVTKGDACAKDTDFHEEEKQGSKVARVKGQGSNGTREQGSKGAREQRSKGVKGKGAKGAKGAKGKGAREQGSKGAEGGSSGIAALREK
ncbi:MAG: hypothetical protein IPL92_18955 [Saprospiraceae bacterium]|nr:hypothetical protein [Candidatus Opimibacter iunctus]